MPSDAVFTDSIGGAILPDNVHQLMQRLCKEADVPYKGIHVLRRSFSSIQGLHGKSVKVVSAHVGPARASFPQARYRTVFESERASLTLEFPTLTKDSDKGGLEIPLGTRWAWRPEMQTLTEHLKQEKPRLRRGCLMVAKGGLEPPTQRFSVVCSTD